MPRLTWSDPANRQLEAGLDRGVLYPKNQPYGPVLMTNLMTNPSSETASGTTNQLFLTNQLKNPLPSNTTNLSVVNGATFGYDAVEQSVRVQVVAGGVADAGLSFGGTNTAAVNNAETWIYVAEVKAVLAGTVKLSVQGTPGTFNQTPTTFAAGEVKRLSIVVTHTAAGTPTLYALRGDLLAADFHVRKMMAIRTGTIQAFAPDYFDGFSRTGRWNHSDYTVAWNGTANNSTSQLRGAFVTAVLSDAGQAKPVRSTKWKSNGTYSTELVPYNGNDTFVRLNLLTLGAQEGRTYTLTMKFYQDGVLAGPPQGASQGRNFAVEINGGGGTTRFLGTTTAHTNVAGTYIHTKTFTVPKVTGDPVTTLSVRIYNGHPPGQTAGIFVDDILFYEGAAGQTYFDGDMASELYHFGWAGTPHASVSTMQLLPGGVPWDGLTSVDENGADGAVSYYVDGRPFLHLPKPKEYSASLKAYTFPDEFAIIQGLAEATDGMFLDSQIGNAFDLSYRTLIANPDKGLDYAYKIHLVYNATVVPQGLSYSSHSGDINPTDFTWDIQAVPVQVAGYRATAHVIIDTRHMDAGKLATLEGLLYGDSAHVSRMPSPQAIFDLLTFGDAIVITDNGDGTWTAEASYENLYMIGDGVFQIDNVNAVDHGDGTYTISTTP